MKFQKIEEMKEIKFKKWEINRINEKYKLKNSEINIYKHITVDCMK